MVEPVDPKQEGGGSAAGGAAGGGPAEGAPGSGGSGFEKGERAACAHAPSHRHHDPRPLARRASAGAPRGPHRRVPAVLGEARARPRRLGIEQEYAVLDGGRLLDFSALIGSLPVPGRTVHPLDPNVYRTATGLAVLADGEVAEVASPPVALAPGFAGAVAGWAEHGRRLLAGLLPTGLRLEGGSTHLSVEIDDEIGDLVAFRYTTTYAPALMLLLDGPDSPGLLVRPRPGRTELCGEYAEDDHLRAAAAFAAGSVLACAAELRGHAAPVPPIDLVVEPGRRRWGWYVDRATAGLDLYAAGRAAGLPLAGGGTVTAQRHMEQCWAAARRALAGHASPADLATTDATVAGRLPLPTETSRSVGNFSGTRHQIAHRTPESAVEGRVLDPRHRPGFDVDVAMATWDFAAFSLSAAGHDTVACVPHGWLDQFLDHLERGALDDVLRAYLAEAPAQRVLAQAGQTAQPGLYDTVAPTTSLLPADRVGVGVGTVDPVRPGKVVETSTTIVEDEPHRSHWWWPWLPVVVLILLITSTVLIVNLTGGGPSTNTASGTTSSSQPVTATGTCGEGLGGETIDVDVLNQPCTYTETQLTGGSDPYESCTTSQCIDMPVAIPLEYSGSCSYVDHFPTTPTVDPVTGASGPSLVGFDGWTSAPPGSVLRITLDGPGNEFHGDGMVAPNGMVETLVPIDSFGRWTVTQFTVQSSPDATVAGTELDATNATTGAVVDVTNSETSCDTASITQLADLIQQFRADVGQLGSDTISLRTLLAVLGDPGADVTLHTDQVAADLTGLAADLSPPAPLHLRWIPGSMPTVHSAAGIPSVVPEDETRLRYAAATMVDPTATGTTAEWFDNTAFPCGAGQAALTVCPAASAPVADGGFVVVAATLDGPVPLGHDTHLYSYGFAFDSDPAAGLVPAPEFPNDFFAGAERFYSADYDPATGWSLRTGAADASGTHDVASSARVLIRNDALVLLVPAAELSGPNPAFRVSTFRHEGDLGVGANNVWSGDVQPAVDEGFAPPSTRRVTVNSPPGAPTSSSTTTTTTTPLPVEDAAAFVAALQTARRATTRRSSSNGSTLR